LHRVSFGVDTTHQCIVWPKDLPLFGACRLSKTELLTSVGRFSMTARTYATSLSLSITTCSTCDAVWFGADAFLPLLPTIDSQSHAVGPTYRRYALSPHPPGSQELMFHLFGCIISPGWTHSCQGSWRPKDRGCLQSLDPCPPSPAACDGGFGGTGRTHRLQPTPLSRPCIGARFGYVRPFELKRTLEKPRRG
jgi:hypothetical protein